MPFSLRNTLTFCGVLLIGTAAAQCSSNSTEYDFVVVGGGTAGLAVAARLSQSLPYECVLVIEAGPAAYDEPLINIPGYKGKAIGGRYDWNYTTVPQAGMMNRTISQTRGKVLGGSSALNLFTWDRGAEADYDAWEALGNEGWNWKSMIAAMLKAENFVPFNQTYGTEGVGYGGVIQTLINRNIPEARNGFIPAMERLGIPNNRNSLGGNTIGAMVQLSNIRYSNWTRSYSPSYLAYGGTNLHVMTEATVSKVNFQKQDDGDLVAIGVEVDGQTIDARKEVVLSAGTLASPTILERSGIGNTSILSLAGIETLLDLSAVGENLQDHVRIMNTYRLKGDYTSIDLLRNATYAAQQQELYSAGEQSLLENTGSAYSFFTTAQLASANNDTSLVTHLTSLALASADPANAIDAHKLTYLTNRTLASQVPEFETIFSDGYTGIQKGYPSSTSSNSSSPHFFTLIGIPQHPLARGTCHMNTTHPTTPPIINPRYLTNPYDLATLTILSKFQRTLALTHPLSTYWESEYEPGTQTAQTDSEWRDYARNASFTIYHPVGSCAMLPREKGGVVDTALRVYGTRNLRVVDASVVPILPAGHVQTLVYGVAERGAVKIIEDWG